MSLTVLIAGGGRVGAALAALLTESGHSVTLVEQRVDRIGDIADTVPGVRTLQGDATDADVLESAGIRDTDVVAAVTGDDPTNIVVASLAKFEFTVPRTIARIVDPANDWLYTEEMGVDVPLEQAQLIAHLVAEEMSLGEMTTLVKLRRGRFALVEEGVHPDAMASGLRLADLELPVDCVLLSVIRGDEVSPAHGAVVLRPGDEIIALVRNGAAGHLHRYLRQPPA